MKFSEEVHFVVNQMNQLSSKETFEILKLRSEVFVEEQNCIYLDPDDSDIDAQHMRALTADNELLAYSRIYLDEHWHIGRISTNSKSRGMGIGKAIVAKAVNYCKFENNSLPIEMSAQVYLTDFYLASGFEPIGSMYLEDGIPHLKMRYQV